MSERGLVASAVIRLAQPDELNAYKVTTIMIANKSDRLECYSVIESVLDQSGFAFEPVKSNGDGVLDDEDTLFYEISDAVGQPETRLMPTSLTSTPENVQELTRNVVRHVEANSQYSFNYHFVLCDSDWTDDKISEIRAAVSASVAGRLIEIYTVDTMFREGFQHVRQEAA